MYLFRGALYGFEGKKTLTHDVPRLGILLNAFADMSAPLFGSFRSGTGKRLPSPDESALIYIDPLDEDPPIQDAVVTFLAGGGACAALSIYAVGYYRFHGEKGAGFEARHVMKRRERDGKLVSSWHILTRRANGQLEDWSRMRGMK